MDKTRILMIDDDPDILRVLEILLQDKYDIIKAPNGLIGYTYVAKYLPDLIILDIMMPKMSGYQFCDLMKKNPSLNRIPILIISAKGTQMDQDYGFRKGASAYIAKPLDNEKVLHTIDSLLKANPPVQITRPSYEQIRNELSLNSNTDNIRWEI